jgi:wyosine [tRNA(Phe)-imidazoG37] synthetase (radical SAM superfamily)
MIIMPLWLQLYVSVDAATKESLKAVDRPLFSDFWERFLVRFAKIFTDAHHEIMVYKY